MNFTQTVAVLTNKEPLATASETAVVDLRSSIDAQVDILRVDLLVDVEFADTPTGTLDVLFSPMALSGATLYDDGEALQQVTCTATTHAARFPFTNPTARCTVTVTNSTDQNCVTDGLQAVLLVQGRYRPE